MPTELVRAPHAAAGPAPARPDAPAPPLAEAHYAQIRQAIAARRSVRTAARTALGSAATTLFIGLAALPFTLIWPSAAGLFIVIGILAVGAMEFQGYRMMQRAEPAAAAHLARNQLIFLGVIILYCVVQAATYSTEDAKAAALSPETRSQLAAMPDMARAIDRDIEQWGPLIVRAFYGLVAVLSIFFQGGLALYYYTRRRHVETFNRTTPAWIRRLFVEIRA